MRAVFTGTTGFGKRQLAECVALEAAGGIPLPRDLNNKHTSSFIQVFCVEENIKRLLRVADLRPFLDQTFRRERLRCWREGMEAILNKVGDSEHSILCFHNVFYRNSSFFSCVDWDLLIGYRPTVFVTLINDVYDIWETVNTRELQVATNSYFGLPEILAWRSAEISATDDLAENLYVKPERYGLDDAQLNDLRKGFPQVAAVFGRSIPHFLFAVKHPVKTLYRLLFRRDLLLTYAAFPITKPRNEADPPPAHDAVPDDRGIAEINNYRKRLFDSEFLTVIDPLTVDEHRLTPALAPGQYSLRPRWPLTFGPPMLSEIAPTSDPFAGYGEFHFEAFKQAVDDHVQSRDYQLVSQAQVLAAYRPYYGGPLGSGKLPSESPSGGVEKELGYASSLFKEVHAVHPPEDRTAGPRMFRNINFAVQSQTIDELLTELQKQQQAWAQRVAGDRIPLTWE